MALKEEFKRTGDWLFRWRSYLPLLLIAGFGVAFIGFKYPHGSHKLDLLWELACLSISLFGLGIRIFTLGYVPGGTSGRNTRRQVAGHLNTTGIYAIVRHPLYLGNFFIFLGLSLFVRVWWFSLLIILAFWIYYERIMFAEEDFLQQKFGAAFTEWASRTPAFLPRFKNWQPPELPFCWKTVIGKEYATLFAIIGTFTLLDIVSEVYQSGAIVFDLMWGLLFSGSLIMYVAIRILKKYTTFLKVCGR
jgi:protein-S-isoprenylcysteine O-methyltransferase Ste14